MPDLLVVHSPLGGGHRSAATSIAEGASLLGLSAEVVDLFELAPRWAADLYSKGHIAGQSYLPNFFGDMYFATNRVGGGLEPLRHLAERAIFAELVRVVSDKRPRAVISTHHLPAVVLAPQRAEGRLVAPLVTVVTDYIAHGFWVEPGTGLYAVPTESAASDLVQHGVARDKILVTGIPVRPAFEKIAPVSSLGSRDLRVLVTTGGFGVGPMRRILRSFRGVSGVELTFVCGKNEALQRSLEREALRSGISARVLGFERDMPRRIAEADVVVGKAGGLTITEAMVAGRALVLVGSVPGNETVNEAIVLREEAGVAAPPSRVGAAIGSMRQHYRELGARGRAFVKKGAAVEIAREAMRIGGRLRRAA